MLCASYLGTLAVEIRHQHQLALAKPFVVRPPKAQFNKEAEPSTEGEDCSCVCQYSGPVPSAVRQARGKMDTSSATAAAAFNDDLIDPRFAFLFDCDVWYVLHPLLVLLQRAPMSDV